MSIEAARNAMSRAGIDPQRAARRLGRLEVAPLRRQAHLHASWPRPSAPRRTSRPATGSSPARPAPRPWWPPSASSAQGWPITPWPSAWTPPRASPATPSNTPPGPAGRPSSSARPRSSLATIDATYSYVTDTPDFWRRPYASYPEHGQRFTGEPAYFKHITEAASLMLEATGTTAQDYAWAVFHQPNTKFPQRVGADAGLHDGANRTRACW